MPSIRLSCALALLLYLVPSRAEAVPCGDLTCGEHGVCDEERLLPTCECDSGYLSVTTFQDGRQGAFCVPQPAAPDDPDCASLSCGPNGACVIVEERSDGPVLREAMCRCDPGFVADAGRCVDDPADDTELACEGVTCGGEGATCMATGDALTCRCAEGARVALGTLPGGGLGPVCSSPPDPSTACGPDNCGRYGTCVIAQGVFCRCEPGVGIVEREGSDGQVWEYCEDGEPRVRPGNGGGNGGDGGGGCAQRAPLGPAAALLFVLMLGARRRR